MKFTSGQPQTGSSRKKPQGFLHSSLLVACVDTGGAMILDCTDCGTVDITAVCCETGVITYLGVIWGGTGGAACG